MSSEVMAWMSRVGGGPPTGASVLAVIAHPDEASFALGAILDAFILAGARVEVLCLTHGQAWTLHGAPGDLAALRGAELASAADVLGPARAKMQDLPDGALGQVSPARLVAEVVAGAGSCSADLLLVFDAAAAAGHLDHVTATSAALLAAERLEVPVLGWALSKTAAAQLNQQPAGGIGHRGEDSDLRVSLERARQRLASRDHSSQTLPGSAGRSQLKLLVEKHSVRWLRPPRSPGAASATSDEDEPDDSVGSFTSRSPTYQPKLGGDLQTKGRGLRPLEVHPASGSMEATTKHLSPTRARREPLPRSGNRARQQGRATLRSL